jgi:hypothetical protein
MQAVCHFYDQYEAKLYLDNGRVLKAGNPQQFTADKTDQLMLAMGRVLKRKSIIA